ncbi:hypothetical protein C0W80_03540 [Photobacterium leiognathi subsp. mandapamensis]|uniref:hypothetical protein n=1 Tax=Photobacterium leiognathi TaxID=553611 RepID=UPI000D163DE1|nr:hypothetical protein [Photobacterium leiognathi]PSV03257.1 hypothetical protein C0W80_03540 [Photobacterium leiognathi subsp. mandapamensis]
MNTKNKTMNKTIKLITLGVLFSQSMAVSAATEVNPEHKGRNDYFAKSYQPLCAMPTKVIATASTLDAASQQEFILDKQLGFDTKLNAKGETYIQLAIKEWDEKFIVGVTPKVQVTMAGADVLGADIVNLQCEKQNQYLTHLNTHEWGSYTLKLTGKPNETVKVQIITTDL